MQEVFEEIQNRLLEVLNEKEIKYTQLKKNLSTYPCHVQIKGFNSLKKISGEVGLDDVFSIWNSEFVWSFLDVTLLEYIVRRKGSSDLKEKMRNYSEKLKKFREQTTVYMLIDVQPDSLLAPDEFKRRKKVLPPNELNECEEAVLNLRESPEQCTLEKLENLRKKTCRKFALSEVALVMLTVSPGCIILVWIIHNAVVQKFKEELKECITNRTYFKENNIVRLHLCEDTFMSIEEVNSFHE